MYPDNAYKLSNAVDGDAFTIIHTSYRPNNLYLDNGFEWLLVYLNSEIFQFVEYISIKRRTSKLHSHKCFKYH